MSLGRLFAGNKGLYSSPDLSQGFMCPCPFLHNTTIGRIGSAVGRACDRAGGRGFDPRARLIFMVLKHRYPKLTSENR